MKKFELTSETKVNRFGKTLFRIKACKSFTTITGGKVKAGDFGGYIEKESNLSHDENAWVCENAEVYGNAKVCRDAQVYGNARVCGDAEVYGDAWVCENAQVYGNAKVCRDARVTKPENVIVIGPLGSRNDRTTFFNDRDGEISVRCGCFYGKIDDFLKEVRQTHGDNKHAKAYIAAAELAKIQVETGKKENTV